MSSRDIFIKAVQSAADIPEPVRDHAQDAEEVREAVMTQSYLDFLVRESKDNPRGAAWEERMRLRHASMSPYLGARTLGAFIPLEDRHFYVTVETESQSVIHWEEFKHAKPA